MFVINFCLFNELVFKSVISLSQQIYQKFTSVKLLERVNIRNVLNHVFIARMNMADKCNHSTSKFIAFY